MYNMYFYIYKTIYIIYIYKTLIVGGNGSSKGIRK